MLTCAVMFSGYQLRPFRKFQNWALGPCEGLFTQEGFQSLAQGLCQVTVSELCSRSVTFQFQDNNAGRPAAPEAHYIPACNAWRLWEETLREAWSTHSNYRRKIHISFMNQCEYTYSGGKNEWLSKPSGIHKCSSFPVLLVVVQTLQYSMC